MVNDQITEVDGVGLNGRSNQARQCDQIVLVTNESFNLVECNLTKSGHFAIRRLWKYSKTPALGSS